jgi:hypothetical protein
LEVVSRIGGVVLSGAVFGVFGLAVSGVLSGVTSFRGVKKMGLYADGRTVFVKGTTDESTGVFQLHIESIEHIVTVSKRTKLRKVDGKMVVDLR